MKHFFQTFRLQIIALLCGLTLWFQVALNKKYETTAELPIIIDNLPENLKAGRIKAHSRVIVQGSGRQLLMLHYQDVAIVINGESGTIGENRFNLHSSSATLTGAPNLRLIAIKSPTEILVNITSYKN